MLKKHKVVSMGALSFLLVTAFFMSGCADLFSNKKSDVVLPEVTEMTPAEEITPVKPILRRI